MQRPSLGRRWFSLILVLPAMGLLSGCQGLNGHSQNPPDHSAFLSASPISLNFNNVPVGKKGNSSESLSNSGNTAVTIAKAQVAGEDFSINGLTLPATLGPGKTLTFTCSFSPSALGAKTGMLTIVSDASNSPANIPLSGDGTEQGQLSISPATLKFGNIVVGTSSSKNGSLTAATSAVTVNSGSTNSSEFVLSGIQFPVTIQAGQSTPFTVTFTPNASGTANGQLAFVSDASNSPTSEALNGTGTAAPQHWVDLTWSPSQGAVAYNVYRKLLSDANYQPIDSGEVHSAYADNNVAAGKTYDYVVTAIDGNNVESGYSNRAEVKVPTP